MGKLTRLANISDLAEGTMKKYQVEDKYNNRYPDHRLLLRVSHRRK